MKLIHLSDSHMSLSPVMGSDPVESFRQALAHVCEHHGDADHVVITGDLAHNGDVASYRCLHSLIHNSGLPDIAPPRLLPGNHDVRDALLTVFPEIEVDHHGFLQSVEVTEAGWFVYLDTVQPGRHAGEYCRKRREWLKGVLMRADEDDQPVWLFMHHPPVQLHVPGIDAYGIAQIVDFQDLLLRFRRIVRHVFFGHGHFTVSGTLQGIGYSAPGSTSHPVWPELGLPDDTLAYGPLERNYNVCLLDHEAVVVHRIDFQCQPDIDYRRTAHRTDELRGCDR